MCRSPRFDATKKLQRLRALLLSLHEALSKCNAALRTQFPPSDPVRRAMESNLSGWINDGPFQIQVFIAAAENALFSIGVTDPSLAEGVGDLIDAARKWAGHVPIDSGGRYVWSRRTSIVVRGLFDLTQARAEAFFAEVWGLKLADTAELREAQARFKSKWRHLDNALQRASLDPEPTFQILLLMRVKVPSECATKIALYIA